MTLTAALESLGYRVRPATNGRLDVLGPGVPVGSITIVSQVRFTGTADEIWAWLRETGQQPLDLRGSTPGGKVIKLGAGALCPYCNVRQIAAGPRAVCSDPDCQRRFREAVERFDAELMAGPPTFLAGYRTGGSKS